MESDIPAKLMDALDSASFSQQGELLAGHGDNPGNQALFLSVPLYPGVKVWVNGREAAPRLVLDCFMEIPLPQGACEIAVCYIPVGLIPGAAVSGSALLLFLLGRRMPRQLFRRVRRGWYRAAPKLLAAAFAAVLLVIYLLPPALWVLF